MNQNLLRLAKLAIDESLHTWGDRAITNGAAAVSEEFAQRFATHIIQTVLAELTELPTRVLAAKTTKYNQGWCNGQLLAAEHIEEAFGINRLPPPPVLTWCTYCGEGVTSFCRGNAGSSCPKSLPAVK